MQSSKHWMLKEVMGSVEELSENFNKEIKNSKTEREKKQVRNKEDHN